MILFFDYFCSGDKSDQEYCSSHHQCGSNYQECPGVPNGKNSQAECYWQPTPDHFDCLNRMDKNQSIFQQRIYQEEPFQLNKDLNYNSSGFFCLLDPEEKFIPWTWDGLEYLRLRTPHCQSKKETGSKRIAGKTLWRLLLRDFGFQGRHHIPEDYIYKW